MRGIKGGVNRHGDIFVLPCRFKVLRPFSPGNSQDESDFGYASSPGVLGNLHVDPAAHDPAAKPFEFGQFLPNPRLSFLDGLSVVKFDLKRSNHSNIL
jgi:hypothetical protein